MYFENVSITEFDFNEKDSTSGSSQTLGNPSGDERNIVLSITEIEVEGDIELIRSLKAGDTIRYKVDEALDLEISGKTYDAFHTISEWIKGDVESVIIEILQIGEYEDRGLFVIELEGYDQEF